MGIYSEIDSKDRTVAGAVCHVPLSFMYLLICFIFWRIGAESSVRDQVPTVSDVLQRDWHQRTQ